MKRKTLIPILLLASAAAVLCVMSIVTEPQAVLAAGGVTSAVSAKAGTGGVTAATFVKLEAAGAIVAATAVTDSVVGVCELTADADALTRYAPVGTQTTVTSGEQIAVGDLLTTGAGGKAFVLDTDDASTQRVAAIALTAASGADESVTVIVCASVAEQRLALAGAFTLAGNITQSGATTFATGTGAVSLNGNVTIAGDKTFSTGTGAVGLNGDVTLSNGATVVNGDGDTLTITEANIVAAGALTTQTSLIVPGFVTGATTCAADVLVIPITHAFVTKTTGGDAEALTLANGTAGQLLVITLGTDGNGDGTLTPDTSTGWATIVFAAAGDNATLMYVDGTVGWVILGLSGLTAQPTYTQ